jgi:hypothetical protein
MKKKWARPKKIRELLDGCWRRKTFGPPDNKGVYVVSRKCFNEAPDTQCDPLYVGGNTGKSGRFRTRIGDLIADIYGFYGKKGHHSGGMSINKFCRRYNINPDNLYISWTRDISCSRCAENEVYDLLRKNDNLQNSKRPNRCKNRSHI